MILNMILSAWCKFRKYFTQKLSFDLREQNSPVSGTKLVAGNSNESAVTGVGRGREDRRVSDHIKYLSCENAFSA